MSDENNNQDVPAKEEEDAILEFIDDEKELDIPSTYSKVTETQIEE